MHSATRREALAVEEIRDRTRRKREALVGPEEASYLMDRPPGGWSDLVTNETLTARLDALRHELKADIAAARADLGGRIDRLDASVARRLRAQTWITTTTMLTGLGLAFTAGRLA